MTVHLTGAEERGPRGVWSRLCAAILSAALLLCAVTPLSAAPAQDTGGKITGYRSVFKPGRDPSGNIRIAIRQFESDAVAHYLLVDPVTLETSLARAAAIDFSRGPSPAAIQNTPFLKALDRHTSPPYKLQNHGAGHADFPVNGMFLTVDMCPSRRPFEKEFFSAVAELSRQSGRGTPLAIAMTGNWLENHRDELGWLKDQVAQGKLAITWVNHSYNHFYEPKTPLERNFLLAAGTDFTQEVLATEQLMLENGLTPSPFFRFPGLVADRNLLVQLRELALLPIGSNAWLAKGEAPHSGSIILVHGNGNEPPGIAAAFKILRGDRGVRLLPLRAAFIQEAHGEAGRMKE
jgi:peptidoglycan/xylan/chitin deacetylase (PgdA/CDA1 family)